MNKLIFIIGAFLIYGCKNPEQSKLLTQEAQQVFFSQDLENQIKIDSTLKLINQAIELDNENLSALETKIIVLTEKRDIEELLKTNSKIIDLRPNQPYWKLQQGLFLELKGNKNAADKIYQQAAKDYENLINGKLTDFDLNMEYLTLLSLNNDLKKANSHLDLMKAFNYEEFQNQILNHYEIETKEKVFEMWNGRTK